MKRKHFFSAVAFLLLALVLCTMLLHQADSLHPAAVDSTPRHTAVLASACDVSRADISALLGASAAHREDALLSGYASENFTASDTDAATHTSLPACDAAVKAVGRVVRKDVRLRAETDPDAAILLFLQEDAYVAVQEECGGWYLVSYDGSTGYVVAEYVELLAPDAAFTTYGTVSASQSILRAAASDDGETGATLRKNSGVTVTGFENGWLYVSYGGKCGYVPGEDVELTTVKPVVKKASSGSGKNTSGKSVEVSGSGADIVNLAQQYVGVPYVYGGAGEDGFDCSGFTMFVYDRFGCSLPHGATSQLNYGSYVDKSSLQAGDLVFFQGTGGDNAAASHVGIYIGGSQFIHASSSSGRTVKISSLDDSYYTAHYLTARRLCS